MSDHVRAIGIVSLLRAIAELLFGGYLLAVVARWSVPALTLGEGGEGRDLLWWFRERFATLHPSSTPESGDQTAFLVLGAVLLTFGLVRVAQSLSTLLAHSWARRAGLVLAAFDFVLPVTLPLAFWGLVVYRHPDTRDYFRGRSRKG